MIDSGKNGQFLSYSKAEEAHRSHTYCSVEDVFLKEPFQPQRWTGIFCLIGLCMSAGETQLEDIKEDWNSLTQMRPLPGCQKSTYFPSVSSEAHVKWGGGGDRLIGVRAHCQPSRTALLSPDQHSVTTLRAFWKMYEGKIENLSGVRVRMHFSLDFPVSSLFRWTTGIQSSGSARDSRREKTWVMINTVWLRHYCLWQRVGASPKQCLSTWQ